MSQCIQFRTDTAANWLLANPVLLSGELAYDSTHKKIKIGNGTSTWAQLPYLCVPCNVITPPSGSGSTASGSSGSSVGSSPIVGSGTGAAVGSLSSGGFRCGLLWAYEGGQGAHTYLVDFEQKSPTMGIWFAATDAPCRFSVQYAADENGGTYSSFPATTTYTSGWRGDLSYANQIAAVSDSDPSLLFPRSYGPYQLKNGKYDNSSGGQDRPMVGRDLLGQYRQNTGWGYLAFSKPNPASATHDTRFAILTIEAPFANSNWACGAMCDFGPMPSGGSIKYNVPSANWGQPSTRRLALPDYLTEFLHDSGNGYGGNPYWIGNRYGYPATGESTFTHIWFNMYPYLSNQSPSLAGGVSAFHDWSAWVQINASHQNSNLEDYQNAFATYSTWNPSAPNLTVRESLYHPITGMWYYADTPDDPLNYVACGQSPPRVS